jgi:hypothetical protein
LLFVLRVSSIAIREARTEDPNKEYREWGKRLMAEICIKVFIPTLYLLTATIRDKNKRPNPT